MASKKASSGGGAGDFHNSPQSSYQAQYADTQYLNEYYEDFNDRKPLGISSGAIEPKNLESERTEVALDQLVHLANILGVKIPVDASIDTV